MKTVSASILPRSAVIHIGKRAIIRENKRFKIYLPMQLNDLWEKLQGRRVTVIIVLED